MNRFVSVLFLLFVCLAAGAQRIDVNPKFGAVSDAEVDMTVYEPDTSAVALMLYRSYDLDLVFDSNIAIVQEITVHERIKVLKEEGKKYADFSFLYLNTTDIKEKYSGVKVETYNRENGKVVKTKMSKKYEFDEKYSDDARRLSFTAENVRVGSVIEVTYQFVTPRFYDIDNIYLQLSIPVNETDVTVGHCEYFRINKSQRGYILPAYRSDNRIKQTSVDGGRLSYQVEMDCYHAVDLPAMQSESFSYCPTQYRTQLLYDLSGVSIPGSVYKDYSATWNDVDKAIAESSIFDEVKAKFRDAKELEAALQGVEGDEARIVAVRKYVTDKVKWDEKSRLVPKGAREVLKQGSGSDADINALTASALNAVGYLAEPVMIRRRSEGVLVDFHASINAFDTFIIKVTTPDASKNWYLDAAREFGYLNVLNTDFLIPQARLMHLDGHGEWVDLTALTKSRVTEMVKASVTPDGTLTGNATIQANNEDSYGIKAQYDDFDSEEEYIEDIESDERIDITSFEIQKEYGPTTMIAYDFERDLDTGDRLYIQPFLSNYHSDTSFRKEKRDIPVDFPYPTAIIYSFVLDIPEGYDVEELPESVTMTCPPVKGRIMFHCKQIGNQISVSYRFTMDETTVLPEYYADLRAFWEKVVGVEKSTIVLKKQ